MPLSDLISFSLKLKGRGHFLSPKELNFIKNLLSEFSEEEVKKLLEKCYKELIPPAERGKTPLTFCGKLLKKKTPSVYNRTENWQPKRVEEIYKRLPEEVREEVRNELRRFFKGKKPNPEEIKAVLRLILRRYL